MLLKKNRNAPNAKKNALAVPTRNSQQFQSFEPLLWRSQRKRWYIVQLFSDRIVVVVSNKQINRQDSLHVISIHDAEHLNMYANTNYSHYFFTDPRDAGRVGAGGSALRETLELPQLPRGLDGKHVRIYPPANSGSLYHNFKGGFSVVLMALVDANLEFIYFDAGQCGRHADGGIWRNCAFNQRMEQGVAHIPPPRELPGTDVQSPYVIPLFRLE